MRYPDYLEADYAFPNFYQVRTGPYGKALNHPVRVMEKKLNQALGQAEIKKDQTIALGVGSRGIHQIDSLVACICRCLKKIGATPIIIPAMGSHGSATPEGQVKVLENLGITQNKCNATIFPEMDIVEIGRAFGEVPVYFSKKALEADHSICINRIKPHTKFKGPLESGLYKMMVVGMGKHQGALAYHNMALKFGFYPLLREMGNLIVKKSNLSLGIGIVEGPHGQTIDIEVIPARTISQREPLLLEKAKQYFPKLPFDELDVLIIGQIGKEISGAGMDPNITGRAYDLMEDDFSGNLSAKRVVVLNLSKGTAGNAIGLGNADIITEKVFQDMDYGATLMNALTSTSLRKAFIPVRLPTEEKAIQAAFQTIGPKATDQIRAVIIKDTLHTNNFLMSRALLKQAHGLTRAKVLGKVSLGFTPKGELMLPW